MPSSTVPGIESPVTVAENSKASCIGVVKFVFQHATSLKDRRPHPRTRMLLVCRAPNVPSLSRPRCAHG